MGIHGFSVEMLIRYFPFAPGADPGVAVQPLAHAEESSRTARRLFCLASGKVNRHYYELKLRHAAEVAAVPMPLAGILPIAYPDFGKPHPEATVRPSTDKLFQGIPWDALKDKGARAPATHGWLWNGRLARAWCSGWLACSTAPAARKWQGRKPIVCVEVNWRILVV